MCWDNIFKTVAYFFLSVFSSSLLFIETKKMPKKRGEAGQKAEKSESLFGFGFQMLKNLNRKCLG